ncbi:unnamed protein product [Moneuplotes crassus]|uniref:Uncharacterized protein n=1 Tax=Euplotes crassus TaxID=5936 RepID=A0AAD1XHA6_EUPCR|nr:unnamed protein product [Moneuplotes crassus]
MTKVVAVAISHQQKKIVPNQREFYQTKNKSITRGHFVDNKGINLRIKVQSSKNGCRSKRRNKTARNSANKPRIKVCNFSCDFNIRRKPIS